MDREELSYSEASDLLQGDHLAREGEEIMTQPLQLEVEHMNDVPSDVAQSFGFAVGETLVPKAPVFDAGLADARQVAPGFKPLTQEEALEAMERHAQSKCCLKNNIAKNLIITNMTADSAVHILFESSTEMRSTKSAHKAYRRGGPVDGPQNGNPPLPWEIAAQPSALFHNESRSLEIPHTSVVISCHGCGGRGKDRCDRCNSTGRIKCYTCQGSGHVAGQDLHHGHHHHHHNSHHHHHGHHHHNHSRTCSRCNGSGHTTCSPCRGKGMVDCSKCGASGLLRQYVRLDIEWKHRKSERILGKTSLPPELVRNVSGVTMFQEEAGMVAPIHHLPEMEVNEAANGLMQEAAVPPTERLLRQRMMIRSVPVFKVDYQWKDKIQSFWVYGNERAVYERDYPGCTSGCSIM